MEANRFDELTTRLASPLSRRRSVGLLGLFGLSSLAAASETDAKKKKKHKKKKKPPTCTPSCDRKLCGSDGCGGSCGSCKPCEVCQGGACVAKANGAACGDACHQCQSGQCVALANGTACGADSCQTCQGGQCVSALDGATCPEHFQGLCRRGVCRAKPSCVSNASNVLCDFVGSCCYQNQGDVCPAGGCNKSIKGAAGHRCWSASDCTSGTCLAYECA